MSKKESKKAKAYRLNQDVKSWSGSQKRRLEDPEFIEKLNSCEDATQLDYLKTQSSWIKMIVLPLHEDATDKDKKGTDKAKKAFETLSFLRVRHGKHYASKVAFNQARRENHLFKQDAELSLPRIAPSKWGEYLDLNPIHSTRRIDGKDLKVTLKGSKKETTLGPTSSWVAKSEAKLKEATYTEKITLMKEDLFQWFPTQFEDPHKEEKKEAKKEEKATPKQDTKGEARKSELKEKVVS